MTYICPRCSSPVEPTAQSCAACGYPGSAPADEPVITSLRSDTAHVPAPTPAPTPPPVDSAWPTPPPPPPADTWPAPVEPPTPPTSTWPPPPDHSEAWPLPPRHLDTDAGSTSSGAAGPGGTTAPASPWDVPFDSAPPGLTPGAGLPAAKPTKTPFLIAGLTVLAAVAMVTWALTGGAPVTARPVAAPPPPASWDPRVTFAVDFVEAHKGLPFLQPVAVNFLPEAEFEANVTGTGDDGDEAVDGEDDGRLSDAHGAAMLRSLGVMAGAVDLREQQQTLAGSSILAYYEPATKQVWVRGTELTPLVKATLVHELAHAWQDQQYQLSRLAELPDSEARFAYRAVVEGDAELVEDAYTASVSGAERQSSRADEAKAVDELESKPVASILTTAMAAPYLLGPVFLGGIRADGGAGRVTQAFTSPPADSSTLLKPWTFGTAGTSRPTVEAPEVPDGRTSVGEDSLGALELYLLLADRIDPHTALVAADTWTGDRFRVVTTDDGRTCLDARIVTRGASAGATLADAFEQWDAAFVNGEVTVTRAGAEVRVEACDPGEDAAVTVPDRSKTTVVLPVVRMQVWSEARRNGATPAESECAAARFVAHMTVPEAVDANALITPERSRELWGAAIADCRR